MFCLEEQSSEVLSLLPWANDLDLPFYSSDLLLYKIKVLRFNILGDATDRYLLSH